MHVLAAFLIIASLFAGFYPAKQIPEDEIYIVTDKDAHIRIWQEVKSQEALSKKHLVSQMYDYSCGSAALATLLTYYLGENFTERQVIQGLLEYGDSELISQRRAFSLLDMKKFVTVLGYKAAGYKATMEDLMTLDKPCIIPLEIFEYNHFTVFKGIYNNHIFISDPWRGNTSYTLEEFQQIWYDNILFLITTRDERTPVLNLLSLSESDLRYIDEDLKMDFMFPKSPSLDLPDYWELDNVPGEHQIYNR